jgi:hypothetical protein
MKTRFIAVKLKALIYVCAATLIAVTAIAVILGRIAAA